jgi:hypothetical protein
MSSHHGYQCKNIFNVVNYLWTQVSRKSMTLGFSQTSVSLALDPADVLVIIKIKGLQPGLVASLFGLAALRKVDSILE